MSTPMITHPITARPWHRRREIERILVPHGATEFAYGWEPGRAVIGCKLAGRPVRIQLLMPRADDRDITHTPTGQRRAPAGQRRALAQATRQRWRALALVIKAKLEAVELGISTLEREFLADIVLPNDQTASRWLAPVLDAAYRSLEMPTLLPRTEPGWDGS